MLKKLLLFSLATVSIMTASATQYMDRNDTDHTVTLYLFDNKEATTVEIPDYLDWGNEKYKITKIASNAFTDMPNLTTVSIGQFVSEIGEVKVEVTPEGVRAWNGNPNNFTGCPKLQKFTVSSENQYFTATGGGILMIKKMQTIVKVPQAMAVTDGQLKMSENAVSLSPGAFAENTTIKKLLLSPLLSITGEDNSFNDMVNLQEFGVSGTKTPLHYTIYQGVLFNEDKTTIISFPPAKQSMSYACPTDVKTIGYKAFANVKLYQVDMPYVSTIENLAFFRAGITNATVTTRVKSLGRYAFAECPRLSKLTFNDDLELPNYLARDCPQLTDVVMTTAPKSIGKGAFKNCAKLKNFPFDGRTDYQADSIFAGCGFDEVVFTNNYVTSASNVDTYKLGKGMFAENKNLTFINLRNMTPTNGKTAVSLNDYFATGCVNLRKIWLPDTYFNGDDRIFGYNPALTEMVVGGFYLSPELPVFNYNSGNYLPIVYMLTTSTSFKYWNLKEFFQAKSPATVSPTIYCEAYSMLDSDMRNGSFIYPGAHYYIPGGTQMYETATTNATVTPMFDIITRDNEGNYLIELTPNLSYLTFNNIYVNGKYQGPVPADGKVVTNINVADVRSIDLYYNVSGVTMHTNYPFIPAGVDSVIADDNSLQITNNSNGLIFNTEAEYTIYDISGRTVTTGHSDKVDTTQLPAGIYIINATAADGAHATAKILR